jgi:hypothetical protein
MDSLTQVSAVLLPVAQPTYRVKTSGSGTQTTRYKGESSNSRPEPRLSACILVTPDRFSCNSYTMGQMRLKRIFLVAHCRIKEKLKGPERMEGRNR